MGFSLQPFSPRKEKICDHLENTGNFLDAPGLQEVIPISLPGGEFPLQGPGNNAIVVMPVSDGRRPYE